MRTVALVGFAENTRELSRQSSADEFWTLNRGWYFDWRIDRLFDMHTLDYLADPNNADTQGAKVGNFRPHWEWLQERHDYPIYCCEAYPEIPSAVRYPLEEVAGDVFGYLWRGNKHIQLFASTFDYMLALAIWEGFTRIEVYGFEMATSTEYSYQRISGSLLMGIAAGRGIDVVIPEESVLIQRMKLYGYEGAQMITRQTLEAYRRTMDDEKNRWLAIANAKGGAAQHMQKSGINGSDLEAVERDHFGALRMMDKYDGGLQLIEKLIAECDMLEVTPELEEHIYFTEAYGD